MSNFMPSYQGIKINIQKASHVELVKEARRLGSITNRRLKPIEREGITTHALELLRNRVKELGLDESNVGRVSTKYSNGQIRGLIKAYDRYLKNEHSSITGIRKSIKELREGIEEFGTNQERIDDKTLASVLNDIENYKDSANRLMEYYDSEIVGKFWKEVRSQNDSEQYTSYIYKQLSDLYNSKDKDHYFTLRELEGIVGTSLR